MKTIKVPAAFYDDHAGRELPTPRELGRTKRHITISAHRTPALLELLADARHYADPDGPGAEMIEHFGLKRSAAATVSAIRASLTF